MTLIIAASVGVLCGTLLGISLTVIILAEALKLIKEDK